jgi:hypothetical protein
MEQKFIDKHPNYKTYDSSNYYVNEVPDDLVDKLIGIILRLCSQRDKELRNICDLVTSYIPKSPTENWGYDFLKNDLRDYLFELKMKYPNFMDFIIDFIKKYPNSITIVEEALEESKIGYYLDHNTYWHPVWLLKRDIQDIGSVVNKAINDTIEVYPSTTERLKLTLEKLSKTDTLLDRKDALREALHSLESFMKTITHTDDIKEADRVLRENLEKWGSNKKIIGEGISIWNRLHKDYPDLRHGNAEIFNISSQEAIFWIQRISIYISYLSHYSTSKLR